MSDLSGRVALVTGGGRGLGRAIACRLASRGAQIHVVDLESTIDACGLAPGWRAFPTDLTSDCAEERLTRYAGSLPRLDILIANAGVVPPWRRVASLDLGEWDRVFAVNVRGVALALKSCAPALAEDGGGSAVLMASINGYRAHPRQALYTATKHAVLGLMRSAALDMGRDGVRVNAVAPGPVMTEALRERIDARAAGGGPRPADAISSLASETALGRLATQADVAAAVCYLAGDESAGITGVCLPVEAGLA